MPRKHSTSREHDNRLRAAKEILSYGNPSVIPCVYCHSHSVSCIVMDPHSKCAECTHRGRPCVGVTWESLDRVRDQLESEILETEEEQARLFAKLSRLRKTLRQTHDQAKQKTLCLLKEMGDDNDGDGANPQPETLSQLFDSMPADFWHPDAASSPRTAEASSRS